MIFYVMLLNVFLNVFFYTFVFVKFDIMHIPLHSIACTYRDMYEHGAILHITLLYIGPWYEIFQ